MAKSKTEKNLCRTIDKWDDYYNEELLEPIFGYIRENKDKYFVAFREGIITIYYKKRVLISLKPESKDKWTIYRREFFKTKSKNPQIVKEFEDLKNEFEDNLKSIGFGKGKQWTMNLEKAKNRDYENLIEATKKYIDKRFEGKDIEETIQGKIACKYQSWNNDYLCVDMEYAQSFDNAQEQKDSRIKGRCDYIFLKKETDTKYKLIYIELKSKKSSCTGYTSAIIDHYSDMMFYFKNYKNKNDPWKIKETIKAGVKFAVKRKVDLKLIDSDISDYIDFDNPEYRILFKMTEGENQPTTKKEIEAFIDEELRKAKATNSSKNKAEMDKNRIHVGEDKIPKYELEKDGNYIKYIKQVKEDVLNNSYYDDSDGFVRIK